MYIWSPSDSTIDCRTNSLFTNPTNVGFAPIHPARVEFGTSACETDSASASQRWISRLGWKETERLHSVRTRTEVNERNPGLLKYRIIIIIIIIIIPWTYHQTDDFISTCSKTEVMDHPPSSGMTFGQNVESSNGCPGNQISHILD